MKKKIIMLSVLILATFIGCTRGNKYSHHDKKYHNGLSDINCSHLSKKQKDFASQLSITHRQVYCKVLSNKQRNKAITLYEKSQSKQSLGKDIIIAPISADQTVENVIKANREDKN